MAKTSDRKIINVSSTRIDLHRAVNGKTPEEVLEYFETLRAKTAEYTFIYKYDARFYTRYSNDLRLDVTRTETDVEYTARMEKNRKISEKKKLNVKVKVTQKELSERKMLAELKAKYGE